MSKEISSTLLNAREMISTTQRNIVESKVAGSRALDVSLDIDPVGGSGKYRTSVVTTRRDDPFKTQALFASVNSASNAEVKANSFGSLQQIIGDPSKSPHDSLLFKAVTSFISQGQLLTGNNDLAVKKSFVNQGVSLANTLNAGIEKVRDLQSQADNDIKSGLDKLNDVLKQISVLNQTMLASRSPETLHNKRDSLIQEVCRKLDVSIHFGQKGVAKILTKGGSYTLVNENSRAEFAYQGVSKQGIIIGGSIPDITISTFNNGGNVILNPVTVVGGSNNPSARYIIGGEIEGLINLRDVELPLAGDALKSLSSGVAKAVNEVHNSGSTWPPKTILEGTKSFYGSDVLDFEGAVTFFALDKNGNQLKGGAGNLNPATIDFSKFQGSGTDNKPTIFELIQEINQKLDVSFSRDRVALGEIKDENNVQIPGEYLLNNIQLAGTSGIDENGNWNFDLDLQGNSYFGSTVEILSAAGPGGGELNGLPDAFRLEKNTDARTGGAITLGGFNPNGGVIPVTIRVRVTGDNGVVREGDVTFRVDQAQIALNKRFAYNTAQAPGDTTGDIVTAGLASHSGVAKAVLVDENGIELDPNAPNVQGKLVIKTNNTDYAIAVQGGNFSSVFGLNNFFEFNEESAQLSVMESIVNDPNQLASGMVNQNPGINKNVKIGDVAAKAEIVFTGNIIVGDSITVDNLQFTFVAGPNAAEDEVIVGVNMAASLQSLADKINADLIIGDKFTATSDGANNKITITTKNGGSWGNDILVSAARANLPDTASINNGVAAQNVGPVNFEGGTDKNGVASVAGYTIGSGSNELLAKIQSLTEATFSFVGLGSASGEFSVSLQDFTTVVASAITGQYNAAKRSSDVLEASLDALNKENTELFGANQDEQWYKAMELAQYIKTLANFARLANNLENKIQDIIFG